MFIEYTWDACYLCAVESVPTEMRATSMGFCSLMARFGAVLSPTVIIFENFYIGIQLTFLNTFWAPSAYLAVVLLGSLNLLVSYLFLIETKNINLDNVDIHKSLEMKTWEKDENEEMIPKTT